MEEQLTPTPTEALEILRKGLEAANTDWAKYGKPGVDMAQKIAKYADQIAVENGYSMATVCVAVLIFMVLAADNITLTQIQKMVDGEKE